MTNPINVNATGLFLDPMISVVVLGGTNENVDRC